MVGSTVHEVYLTCTLVYVHIKEADYISFVLHYTTIYMYSDVHVVMPIVSGVITF